MGAESNNLMTRLAELQAELTREVGAELQASEKAAEERALAAEDDLHWRLREAHNLRSVSYRMEWSRHSQNANRLRAEIGRVQRLMQEDADMTAISNEQFLRRLTLQTAEVEGTDDMGEHMEALAQAGELA